jgi:hypothetical protein
MHANVPKPSAALAYHGPRRQAAGEHAGGADPRADGPRRGVTAARVAAATLSREPRPASSTASAYPPCPQQNWHRCSRPPTALGSAEQVGHAFGDGVHGGVRVGRNRSRHDLRRRDAQAGDAWYPQLGVDDRHLVCPHPGATRVMRVAPQVVRRAGRQFVVGDGETGPLLSAAPRLQRVGAADGPGGESGTQTSGSSCRPTPMCSRMTTATRLSRPACSSSGTAGMPNQRC